MSCFGRLLYFVEIYFETKTIWEKLHVHFNAEYKLIQKNQIRQIANNGPDMSTRHKLMHYYF